jgi:(p)ppGpp synthase/HD superfamily hydrolase
MRHTVGAGHSYDRSVDAAGEITPDPAAALAWSRELHAAQRYGDQPYEVHLNAVADVLRRFGHGDDPVLMSAAYLHDAVEDQGVDPQQIAERFGGGVAAIVDAVSDPPGASRGAQKAAAYPRIRALDEAVIVKLADRIANVEAGGPKVAMYAREQAAFRGIVRSDGVGDELWAYLERLLRSSDGAAG